MSKKYAFLFPGQGAQYPGMAKDFHDQFPIARATFQEADDLLEMNFSKLIFEGPAPELTLTKNSQLGIYIASMAIYRTLQKELPYLKPTVCAGLSLGEYTALTAAGRISFQECLFLVKARAQYMNDACESTEGTMQVVLGMEPEKIEEILKGLAKQVWVANLNCPGQVVIAGSKTDMPIAAAAILEKGAKRALPLDVSGAFHTPLMQEAQNRLTPLISSVKLIDSDVQIVMNAPGDYVSDLNSLRSYLTEQVTKPVRWEKGVRAMVDQGIDAYIEMGCGKTLAGMNKRIGVTAPTYSVEKISDLEALESQLETTCSC